MFFFNSEVFFKFGNWFCFFFGKIIYNKKVVDEVEKEIFVVIVVVDVYFVNNIYFVGECIIFVDFFVIGLIVCGFEYFFGKEFQ